MMFQKKVDRAMNWLKEKNKNKANSGSDMDFERRDILALVLSAALVFAPIFLVLAAVMMLISRI